MIKFVIFDITVQIKFFLTWMKVNIKEDKKLLVLVCGQNLLKCVMEQKLILGALK